MLEVCNSTDEEKRIIKYYDKMIIKLINYLDSINKLIVQLSIDCNLKDCGDGQW